MSQNAVRVVVKGIREGKKKTDSINVEIKEINTLTLFKGLFNLAPHCTFTLTLSLNG